MKTPQRKVAESPSPKGKKHLSDFVGLVTKEELGTTFEGWIGSKREKVSSFKKCEMLVPAGHMLVSLCWAHKACS